MESVHWRLQVPKEGEPLGMLPHLSISEHTRKRRVKESVRTGEERTRVLERSQAWDQRSYFIAGLKRVAALYGMAGEMGWFELAKELNVSQRGR
jgi:hypothetical protein